MFTFAYICTHLWPPAGGRRAAATLAWRRAAAAELEDAAAVQGLSG